MMRSQNGIAGPKNGMGAILAAVALMLEPSDAVVSTSHGNAFAELFLPVRRGQSSARALTARTTPLAFAGGAAAGAQVAGNSGLVVVLLDGPQTEPGWAAVLEQAQSDRLPLIVICMDIPPLGEASRTRSARTPASEQSTLTWPALNKAARKLRFPVLTVDGADVVAVYRAMQESVLRARHGDGPALLWCIMPATSARSRSSARASQSTPLQRLEGYLAARRIPLPTLPTAARRTPGSLS